MAFLHAVKGSRASAGALALRPGRPPHWGRDPPWARARSPCLRRGGAEERGRALALLETGWIAGLQSAGARADKLSQFATYRGDAALVNAEPERHAAVTVEALAAFARTWLVESNRATLLYVPQPTPAAEAA